jgi:prepilin peptidase CpaA
MEFLPNGFSVPPVFPEVTLACALALLVIGGAAAWTDVSSRRIPNALPLAAAVLAPVYWVGWFGLWGVPALGVHLVPLLLLAIPLALLFGLRVIAGGDVKLMLALALWIPVQHLLAYAMIVVLAGGIIGGGLRVLSLIFWRIKSDSVPYGLAIVFGALVVLEPTVRHGLAGLCMMGR